LDECYKTFQNKLRSDKQSEVLKRSIRKGKLGPGEQRENIWFGIEKCNHQIIDNERCTGRWGELCTNVFEKIFAQLEKR
jgi:hypothetical protein